MCSLLLQKHLYLLLKLSTIFTCCYLQVKHSRTSSQSSYEKDFRELIDIYIRKRKTRDKKQTIMAQEVDDVSDVSDHASLSEADETSPNDLDDVEDSCSDRNDGEVYSTKENGSTASTGKEMSVEYLENDVDIFEGVDDWDGTCFI